jgi:hypothetical protein
MKSASFSVGTEAVQIVASSVSAQDVYVHVEGNGTVYVGGATVTTATGVPTEKHTTPINFFLPRGNELWAIAATTQDVRVMTEGA